ncbi:MAG: nitroreductase [Alphaproteobacteria bacterium]|nr:nitroreductase [Alphaproteobacteria bacterium]
MAPRRALPPEPDFGVSLAPFHESPDTLRLLALRRSTPVAALTGPGPGAEDVADMLRLACRVPDHRKLEPWRFLLIEGAARQALGEVFAAARRLSNSGATRSMLESDRQLPLRAPVIIVVISSPVHDDPKQTPIWEQELSAGALCQNLMIAACAMGWAACWITEWPAYDPDVCKALGVAEGERIAGFLYLGTAKEMPVERQRPDVPLKLTRWD